MIPSPQTYYQHKDKFNIKGPLLGIAFGTAAAIPASFAYAYFTRFVPLVYINWIISFLAVFLVALAYVAGERMGKNRSRVASFISALIMSFITLYIFWAAFITVLSKGSIKWTPLLFDPKLMVNIIESLIEVGWFTIKRSQVKGSIYGGMLAIEAVVYVAIFIFSWWEMLMSGVYCEDCNTWGNGERLNLAIEPTMGAEITDGLKNGDWSWMNKVTLTQIPSSINLEISRCEKSCENFILLSVIHLTTVEEKDGPETTEKYLLQNIYITPEQLSNLKQLELNLSSQENITT